VPILAVKIIDGLLSEIMTEGGHGNLSFLIVYGVLNKIF
jgi:hypothetical protein